MKRGSPLKRSSPLARKSPLKPRKRMKRGPSRRTLNRTLAAALYVRWLHDGRPCACRGDASPCSGRIEQAHARGLSGPTGLGLKESDFDSIPLCSKHHRDYDQHKGVFAGWSREARKRWMRAAIAVEHVEFKLGGGVIPDAREAG